MGEWHDQLGETVGCGKGTREGPQCRYWAHLSHTNIWRRRDDKLIWPYTKEGTTQVKSVYHRRQEQNHRSTDNNDNANRTSTVWKLIWTSKALPKGKNFIWRLTLNALVVSHNLQRRGMAIDPSCPVCGRLKQGSILSLGANGRNQFGLVF